METFWVLFYCCRKAWGVSGDPWKSGVRCRNADYPGDVGTTESVHVGSDVPIQKRCNRNGFGRMARRLVAFEGNQSENPREKATLENGTYETRLESAAFGGAARRCAAQFAPLRGALGAPGGALRAARASATNTEKLPCFQCPVLASKSSTVPGMMK